MTHAEREKRLPDGSSRRYSVPHLSLSTHIHVVRPQPVACLGAISNRMCRCVCVCARVRMCCVPCLTNTHKVSIASLHFSCALQADPSQSARYSRRTGMGRTQTIQDQKNSITHIQLYNRLYNITNLIYLHRIPNG